MFLDSVEPINFQSNNNYVIVQEQYLLAYVLLSDSLVPVSLDLHLLYILLRTFTTFCYCTLGLVVASRSRHHIVYVRHYCICGDSYVALLCIDLQQGVGLDCYLPPVT